MRFLTFTSPLSVLSAVAVLIIFSGCKSTPPIVSRIMLEFSNSVRPNYGAIIFTTDSPQNLDKLKESLGPYIADFHGNNLVYDRDLEEAWNLSAYMKQADKGQITKKMAALTQELSQKLNQDIQNDAYPSLNTAKLARDNLSSARRSLTRVRHSMPGYTELVFWAAVAQWKHNPTEFRKAALLYGSIASPEQIKSLESNSELPIHVVADLYKYKPQYTKLELQHVNNCRVLVNGRPIRNAEVNIVRDVPHAFSADCQDDGVWGKVVESSIRSGTIEVFPNPVPSFASMPSTDYLDLNDADLTDIKYDRVLFVHYSEAAKVYTLVGRAIDERKFKGRMVLQVQQRGRKKTILAKIDKFSARFGLAKHAQLVGRAH